MSQDLLEKSNYYLQNSSSLKKEDISDLQEILREHNKLYYNEESPIISDKEYDELFKILKNLEENFNISDYNSPTQKIDVLLSKQFKKGLHLTPMLSLDNTYNSEDLYEFDKRISNILKKNTNSPLQEWRGAGGEVRETRGEDYIIELKFDGLGISLIYKDGELIRALTRGKGDEGEDVTINIMQIQNIPKTIPFKTEHEVEIRGEIIMPISEFIALNKSRQNTGEKLFANPRNAASGSVRQLDYNITKSRNLKFFAYSFPYLETSLLTPLQSASSPALLQSTSPLTPLHEMERGIYVRSPQYIYDLAKKLRKTMTDSEKFVWELLRNRNFCDLKFRRQHSFGRYIADFYCPELGLVIELDGKIHKNNIEYDQIRNDFMTNSGLKLLRFENDFVLNNTDEFLNTIKNLTPLSIYGEGSGVRSGEGPGVRSYSEILKTLKSFGFSTSPYFYEAKNIQEVVNEIEKVTINKPSYEFETDGLVIKLNDLTKWKKLGFTEHHPRYSIAYKFPATNVRTKVLDVEHSVGRTGILTPVAHLDPVNVSGVIVSRATLHNYDELQKKEIKLGDEVFIVRAGEVIPEVVSVIKEARTGEEKEVIIPEFCPSCNTKLKKDEGKVAWYCPNKKLCPAQTLGSLISFVSRPGANIEGLGDKIIEIFISLGFITDFVSIYHLKEFQNEILTLEGFKDKKVNNILDEIENSRKMPLANFFVSLGIPQVGKKTAKTLANYIAGNPVIQETGLEKSNKNINLHYSTLNSQLPTLLFSLKAEELEQIKDIGPIGAHSVVYYFEEYQDLVLRLLDELEIILPERKEEISSLPLDGKSFCVTGSFEKISRDEIHKIIEENGGETRTSVTKNLDYLIVGSEAGSKLNKAKELGVKIISLEEFNKLI